MLMGDGAAPGKGMAGPTGDFRRRLAVWSGSTLDRVYGRGTGRYLPRLERMQWWDADRLHAYQKTRIASLLHHCHEKSSFYRRRIESAGISEKELDFGIETLGRLAPLLREDLRRDPRALWVENAPRMRAGSTSGSSGSPVTVWQDLPLSAWTRAVQRRSFRWFGVEPNEPRVLLLAAPDRSARRFRHRVVDLLTGRRLVEFHDLTRERMAAVLDLVRSYRPSVITAYPSVLHELCLEMQRQGGTADEWGVRLLHCQSEMVLDLHRSSFEGAFPGVPVLDEYGCVEVGAMAYTCPMGSFHVMPDQVVLEVVDEEYNPVAEGESGRILLTPLEARGMPLIRYDIGDTGSLTTAPCRCGRFPGAPILTEIGGRTFEQIVGLEGSRFNSGIIHFVVKRARGAGGLAGYLAIQDEPGKLRYELLAEGEAEPDFPERLSEAGRVIFGERVEVSATYVSELPARQARKRSYFESRLNSREHS